MSKKMDPIPTEDKHHHAPSSTTIMVDSPMQIESSKISIVPKKEQERYEEEEEEGDEEEGDEREVDADDIIKQQEDEDMKGWTADPDDDVDGDEDERELDRFVIEFPQHIDDLDNRLDTINEVVKIFQHSFISEDAKELVRPKSYTKFVMYALRMNPLNIKHTDQRALATSVFNAGSKAIEHFNGAFFPTVASFLAGCIISELGSPLSSLDHVQGLFTPDVVSILLSELLPYQVFKMLASQVTSEEARAAFRAVANKAWFNAHPIMKPKRHFFAAANCLGSVDLAFDVSSRQFFQLGRYGQPQEIASPLDEWKSASLDANMPDYIRRLRIVHSVKDCDLRPKVALASAEICNYNRRFCLFGDKDFPEIDGVFVFHSTTQIIPEAYKKTPPEETREHRDIYPENLSWMLDACSDMTTTSIFLPFATMPKEGYEIRFPLGGIAPLAPLKDTLLPLVCAGIRKAKAPAANLYETSFLHNP